MKGLLFFLGGMFMVFSIKAQDVNNFNVTDINGNTHDLYTYLDQGKVVLYEVWGVNCGICATNLIYLEQLYQEYSQNTQGLIVLAGEAQLHTNSEMQDFLDGNLGSNDGTGNVGTYPTFSWSDNSFYNGSGPYVTAYWNAEIDEFVSFQGPTGLGKTALIVPGPNGSSDNQVIYAHVGSYTSAYGSGATLYNIIKPKIDSVLNPGSSNPNPPLDCSTLQVNAGSDQTINEGSSVSVSASTSGGHGLYQYNWSPSTALNATSTPNVVASPTQNICYTVEVTDDSNCVATDQVCITVIPAQNNPPLDCSTLQVNAGSDQTINEGSSANLSASAQGNHGGVSFSWTPSTALNSSSTPNVVASPAQNICYTVQVTDDSSCVATDQVCVTVVPAQNNQSTQVVDSFCGTTISDLATPIFCEAVPGVAQYHWKLVHSVTGSSITYTRSIPEESFKFSWVPNIDRFGTYDVSVRANINNQWTNFGLSCQISLSDQTVLNTTAFEIVNTSSSVTVFPNPVSVLSKRISFDFQVIPSGMVRFYLFDIHGKLIQEHQVINMQENHYNFELSNPIEKGHYILQIENEQTLIRKKVLVN